MNGSGTNQKASSSSNPFMNNNDTTTISSDVIQPGRRMVQNYSLLWLDESMDQTNNDYENTLKQIQNITGTFNVFKQRDACIDFLTDAQEDIKSFLIIKNTLPQQIMPLINDIPQLDSVYIFSSNESLQKECTKNWQKIRSVDTNIDDLCKALQSGVKKRNQNSIAMSFITVNEIASINNLNQLEPTFMYSQLLKETLLNMEYNKQAIKDFITYCRQNDYVSGKIIDQFEKEYHAQLAIWWYTFPSNIYSVLNCGLRTLDADIIITMGFFLRDLHKQIQQLYEQQISTYGKQPFVVYRGQGLIKSDFEKLQKTQGGLISFNNFLSTSKDKHVSLEFAECASTELNKVGILFVMSIDPCIKLAPFASIKGVGYFKEEDEILFSMHTIFRVIAIKPIRNENQLYQVELQLTSDDDQQLRSLTDWIRQEAGGDTGWQRLGNLLLQIGQFHKAEELYNVLLKQTSDEDEKALYYHQLGGVHLDQGDYKKAIWYFEKTLEMQKTLSSNHSDLGSPYNSIGNVYNHMGEYPKALSFYEKALDIWQKALPSNHFYLASLYNNIGSMYHNVGEYSKALSFYEKAFEIQQKTLPSNHPLLATSYSNIGNVYNHMGEYSKALSFYEKAFEIQQKTLPSNHPLLAASYGIIGSVYDKMGEYSKAISFYEKAIEIRQKALPSNHPDLATTYNNIGLVYDNMGQYSKALSFYEKALDIWQKTLPSNHPHLAISYGAIGLVYDSLEKYLKALSFYEKALEIQQKALPLNHPELGTLYNNIGSTYNKMGECSKALSFYEKVLDIWQKSLPSNHPHLASAYSNIGSVYYSMEEYSKALSSHEKALEIFQKTLPSNHPSLATSYNNIGGVHCGQGDYEMAIWYLEKAFEIWQNTLPSDHPHIKCVKQNIEMVQKNIKNIR